mmetsp:Transcript_18571/g.25740  ORF Transcript_18571/g.25740 Transcript_18571/m.25740 type:complete len:486 (+) Transcript_18571:195-1652(+)|eukprot:CAMPEP_0196594406 /NCGR_PEP_ID=MMETSP1081-20130531/78297_1 /TAXON_ID=36882 /ORGANISM="Pyramimonas amylifera, Strain CCMP720" /LENGTH=485 /DNA_ID=CAMNT_0041918665 /DNA_START=104 /DNA_END=1561 /DNA_ORIENTATION=+
MADKAKEAIAFLQKTSDASGGTVYDHLAAVVGKILEDRPDGAVDLLETTLLVKKTQYNPKDTPVVLPTKQNPKDTARAVAIAKLYETPEAPIDPETGEPEEVEPPNEFETENILSDAAMFAAVGVGFSQTEWYSIMLTIKNLGEDPIKLLKTVRFFGKFFGIKSDYYVFEATLQEEPEPPEEEADPNIMPPEEPGTGANSYTYYVCQQLGGPVTKLPPVTPTQITVARQIKKFLIGDLKSEVSAFPPFPGVEANFLRAQISRIAATTVICPLDFFAVGEDEVTLERSEEFEPKDATEMVLPENWCHRYPHIKPQGRCVWWAPPPPEEDEEGAEDYEEPEPQESPELLATLDADAVVVPSTGGAGLPANVPPGEDEEAEEDPKGVPAWSKLQSSAVPSVQYQVVGLRSNLWPGSVAVCAGASFSNVYIGYGLKNQRLIPPPPPAVNQEWKAPEDEEGNPTYLLMESNELPPPPEEEVPEDEEEEED